MLGCTHMHTPYSPQDEDGWQSAHFQIIVSFNILRRDFGLFSAARLTPLSKCEITQGRAATVTQRVGGTAGVKLSASE